MVTAGACLGVCQVSKLLQYSPLRRYSALQALTHPFFDELREGTTTLPNGARPLSLPGFPKSVTLDMAPLVSGLGWEASLLGRT